jgi:alkaline phosphatase D
MYNLPRSALLALLIALVVTSVDAAHGQPHRDGFHATFDALPDRIWLGPEFWANPMEDWAIGNGRIECRSAAGNRNVHLLTHQLGPGSGGFFMSVLTGVLEQGETGGRGFRIAVHDQVNDYRGNCFWGGGIDAGIANRQLVLGEASKPLDPQLALRDLLISLEGKPAAGGYELILTLRDPANNEVLESISTEVPNDRLIGNIALVNNYDAKTEAGSRAWFDDWIVSGEKFVVRPEQKFGPILWSMYTLSNTRTADRYELALTAQMPPIGENDGHDVALQVKRGEQWQTLANAEIDPDSRTANFRIPKWDQTTSTPYRLVWKQLHRDGGQTEHHWAGTIRLEPLGRPLVLAGMTCQHHHGYPYEPVVDQLKQLDPDVLFFSGDQIYEENGHYGITRRPAEAAILSYLRKWYMFGWTFGDLMRDRPTLCIPDDHDVFQGNIWGAGGEAMPPDGMPSAQGGYIQPVRMVNVVHTTNTSHHPRFFDPTPAKRDMSVYYGDMVYGRTSFAIISDRQWKSGPEGVRPGEKRADHIPQGVDVKALDRPGLELLGERQEKFLEHWVQDWRGADMKVLLSETLFANIATHHGPRQMYLAADLDSGAWPQTPRNRAIRILRKGFPLHVNGDQHLGSLVHYGVEDYRDSFWSFCTPAVSVGYQRWWLPDETGRSHTDRPEHGLPNTGKYLDGLRHPTYVYAVGNPIGSQHANRYERADLKASGFGIVRIDTDARTYTCEAYGFLPRNGGRAVDPFAGWPLTIQQTDNYARQRIGYLPAVSPPHGMRHPVVKVYSEQDDQLVYALRMTGDRFEPFVFEDGSYRIEIGDPDTDEWTILRHQSISARP